MAWGKYRIKYAKSGYPMSMVSRTYTRLKRVIEIGDIELFLNEVFCMGSEHIASVRGIKEIIYYTPDEIKCDEKFLQYFGVAFVRFLEKNISLVKKIRKYGGHKKHTYLYPNLIRDAIPLLTQNSKNEVTNLITKYSKNFGSLHRKTLACLAIEFVDYKNPQAFEILEEFYRILDPYNFNRLITKIPRGLENQRIKEILSKTHLFDYLKYSEEIINSSEEKKIELIKAIAKTPTLIKRLPFDINIGFEHLKEIAPVMRFKFMQFAFKHELYSSRNGYFFGETLKRNIKHYKSRNKECKLIMPSISIEQMKELLFSICLKKNEEFVKWIKNYELYLVCLNATKKTDISKYR